MIELADEKTNPDKKTTADVAQPIEDNFLILNFGNQVQTNIPIIELETLASSTDENAAHVFALAGIEGQADIFNNLAKKLKIRMTCLQFCTNNNLESVEDIASLLLSVNCFRIPTIR